MTKQIRRHPLAFVVLAAGLLLSLGAWRLTAAYVNDTAEREFQRDIEAGANAIESRAQDTVNLLNGLRGLFLGSAEVERAEFDSYISALAPEQHLTGLRAISFSRYVTRAQKRGFEARVRGDASLNPAGYPNFAIKPPGEREEYLPIEYLRPMADREAALGLDLLADPARRGGIVRARDLDRPAGSGPVEAVTTPGRTLFIVRMPVYRRGRPIDTVERRRAAFYGVVSAAIDVEELVQSVLVSQMLSHLGLTVHDLGVSETAPQSLSARNVLFDNTRRLGSVREGATGAKNVVLLNVAGRAWRLSFYPGTGVYGVGPALSRVVLGSGIATSLLLFWLIWTLSISRARALASARQATEARAAETLREQLSFIQQLIEAVPQPIFFKDFENRHYLGVNKAWEKFFGIPREQFIGKTVFELYPNDPKRAESHHAKDEELFAKLGSQSYEAAIVAADGSTHHTIYNKATFNKPDGSVAGLIGTITDVSGLKETEGALRRSEARFRDLTELSSDWYWEQDADLRFTQISAPLGNLSLDAAGSIGMRLWEIPCVGVTEEQWAAHKLLLARHEPFEDFTYQRHGENGKLLTINVSGRPVFDEAGKFTGYRGIGRDVTAEKEREEQIRHMAHHDALTALPNRVLLQDRIGQAIAQARRNRRGTALLFIDLDRFKMVNDSLGHHIGDELLRAVAARFRASVRATDTVARIGGDEFVLLLTDLDKVADARIVAQKLVDAFSQSFMARNHELHTTPSIGIATYPEDGENAEVLLRNADTAMYHAKEMGRNNYQFFTAAMNVVTHERLAIERDLRLALERGELRLHYQPQIDLRTGAIIGFEALARWYHPERGIMPPSEFIQVAEETGLINPLGKFVLQEACRQAQVWRAAGFPQLQVAVNCSAQQFRREGMVKMVASMLEEVGLPPECLELEITESVMIQQPEQVIEWFRQLSDMGLQLSLDDFGTGYSSLSYLKRFPIRKLKIDQAFVRDIGNDKDDAAIVSAIIAMAHSLGLEVIAEGVETAEQLAFLKSLGCDKAQGYYFSKPVPADEFLKLL